MPGTTRYSATFDRPYEEDELANSSAINGSRRSRSQSWQAPSGANGLLKNPNQNALSPTQKSMSSENGQKGAEHFPTRTTAKNPVKTHNNPFQFVKVGTSSLYKKAEEQLQKVKEIKKPTVVKEEEEEWQSNLDSWKTRRRKMSEDVFRRQEEIRQFELEEQSKEQSSNQKKTKTFSEMVESRATRGRALSLGLIASPLDLQKWESENNISSNPFSEESEENSAVNSEDEGLGVRQNNPKKHNTPSKEINRNAAQGKNSAFVARRNKVNKFFEIGESGLHHREGVYVDSGLESISSSHRAGDTPDSCSDFSQDSSSSVDCDSPRVSGLILNDVNLLEFSKPIVKNGFQENNPEAFIHTVPGKEVVVCLVFGNSNEDLGFTFKCFSNDGQVVVSSVSKGSVAQTCGMQVRDQIITINDVNVGSKTHSDVLTLLLKAKDEDQIDLLLWRPTKDDKNHFEKSSTDVNLNSDGFSTNSIDSCSPKSSTNCDEEMCDAQKQEKSIESENEVFVDDIETLHNPYKSDVNGTKAEKPKTCNEPFAGDVTANSNSTPESATINNKIGTHESSQFFIKLIGKPKPKIHFKEDTDCNSDSNGEETVKIKISKKKRMSNANIVLPSHITDVSSRAESNFTDTSLNVIFQSKPEHNHFDIDASPNPSQSYNSLESVTLQDIPPVEKVAEEMERLILQQLEEEERAKEISFKAQTNLFGSSEHNFTAPSKLAEPPKEKPPPPPSENEADVQKPLKRVNSTKRIKKEIYKRRSNFLGIDNVEESDTCESIRPPPALEQILKAEMELDRENMKRLEHAAAERLRQEEKEIQRKEREIIENLEMEERQKHLITNDDVCEFIQQEEERIQALREERQKLENIKLLEEEQKMRLEEEIQLKEREQFVKHQEVESSSSGALSALLLSDSLNNAISINASLSEVLQPQLLSGACGDGEQIIPSSCSSESVKMDIDKTVAVVKPAVPPKPFKKKEAIRKERERLRQEQEELQREREDHRRKLQLAQDKVAKTSPKVHVDPVVHIRSQPAKSVPAPCAPVYAEAWMHQKVSPAKKPPSESTESKYNQNHWLIQEAEMRRIAEQRERQHLVTSQTHLAEDEVCSKVLSQPDMGMQYRTPVNMPIKKCPPPIPHAKPALPYNRDVVPPAKPSRVVPLERQEQMLSVSGRKRCSHCNEELGRGAAMIIESLQLCYHIQCFQCCVCQSQLGNGSCGTDVRVRNNKLHCHNCYSNDEAGLKFSQV